jgi:hypothetical protein
MMTKITYKTSLPFPNGNKDNEEICEKTVFSVIKERGLQPKVKFP